MSNETFHQLRDDLARTYEISHLSEGDTLGFTLEIEDGLPINVYFDEVRDQLVLFCGLGAAPAENRAAVLEKAMGLNLYAAATQGGAIGYDAEAGLLSLARCLPVRQMDLPAFQSELQLFVDTAISVLATLMADETPAGGEKIPASHAHLSV